ncbi:MAG: MoaD/ThiS family protein [Deltaproteobacteria bacterium]|nr:MoaD/ThiS family protein [Candidatus Tharpella aukensis]
MRLTIKLFADFRQGRFAIRECEFCENRSVSQIMQELVIPPDEVGVLLCNGRHVDFERELVDGDTCSIFPKIGGG